MFELGQMLREARIEKDISLENLEETTKIRKRYLEAIEEGNFKVLPGSFYVRAFIKSYAEAVGLDPAEVLKLYGSVLPKTTLETTAEPSIKSRRTNFRATDRWNKWATRIMVWSFVLLIAGIIYFVVNNSARTDNSRKVSENQNHKLTDRLQSEVQNPMPGLEVKVEEVKATPAPTPTPTPPPEVKLVRSENGTDYYQVTKAAKLTVQMSIVGDKCWIQIDKVLKKDDSTKNEMIEQGTLVNGNEKSWNVEQPVFLTLGAANAVELKVNGTLIPVGDSANVRRFQFDLPNT